MSNADYSAYYKQATDAADRGDFEYAMEICQKAAKHFHDIGKERSESNAYHLLGRIAYRQGDLKEAETWYLKALAIDSRTDNDWGAARTCTNLSAVAHARGEYDTAEQWLSKAIRMAEGQADERGLACSYNQMGILADSRGDLDAAAKWYLKSLALEEGFGNEVGVAETCINLCGVATKQGDNDSAVEWRRKALRALGRQGHASAAIKLGQEAEVQGDIEESKILYWTALDIAKEHGDDDGQSLSYGCLAHLANEVGDYTSAMEYYEKAIEIEENIPEVSRAAQNCIYLAEICLKRINGGRRDFSSARRWFSKSLELKRDTSWRDSLSLHGRYWYYRLLSAILK